MADDPQPFASGEGDSLDEALDAFLEWAEHEGAPGELGELPHPELVRIQRGSVLGEFELGRELGAGGMGVVYEARQLSVFGRRVAVKVLRNLFASRRLEERFRREIEAISSLDHPGIVPIVAAGVESGVPFYAMKFVSGMSAASLVRRLRERAKLPPDLADVRDIFGRMEGTSEEDEEDIEEETSIEDLEEHADSESSYAHWVARVGMLLAEALQHAHDHGVVHRDVKPANIVVTPHGRPVLLDFGLAVRHEDASLTRTGDFLGTLAYVSPEQARGGECDGRGDVYSLGASLYELLTLRRPFEGTQRTELLRRIEEGDLPELDRWVPRELQTIISCALSKNLEKRYGSAASMAHDLRAFLAGKPIRARPPGLLARARRATKRHVVGLSIAFVMGFLALFGFNYASAWRRASACVDEGDRELRQAVEARARIRDALGSGDRFEDWRHAGTYPPAAPSENDALTIQRRRIEAGIRAAERSYRRAFEHLANFGPANIGLGRLFAAELAIALEDDQDVLHPERITRLEAELARTAGPGQRALLDRYGTLQIRTTPPDAFVSLFRLEGERRSVPVLSVNGPLRDQRLPEGRYLAEISSPGAAPTVLPLLVRRDARLELPGEGPRNDYEVELLPAELVPPGFVFIPAGWTLCNDDPVRWEYVESFCIQRHEVTFGDWLTLRNDLPEALLSDYPRDPYVPSVRFIQGTEPGKLRLQPDVRADWPVYGLTRMEMDHFVAALQQHRPPASDGWYYSLPTRAEWVRAARGADARKYPWGNDFSWTFCGGSPSHERSNDIDAFPSGAFPGDVSPFGVRDLAGNVSEATLAAFPTVRGEFLFCGGSHRKTQQEEMRVTAMRSLLNEPRLDAGFRVVLRRLPAWARPGSCTRQVFRDDFERPDSKELGGGWIATANQALSVRTDPQMRELARIQGGRLILQGGSGHHSEPATAYHPLCVGIEGFDARLRLRATRAEERDGRSFGVAFQDGIVRGSAQLALYIDFRGGVQLRHSPGDTTSRLTSTDPGCVPVHVPLELDIRVRADGVRAWVWPVGSPRPQAPTVELEGLETERPLRILQIDGQNFVGVRVEVDEIEVVPQG